MSGAPAPAPKPRLFMMARLWYCALTGTQDRRIPPDEPIGMGETPWQAYRSWEYGLQRARGATLRNWAEVKTPPY